MTWVYIKLDKSAYNIIKALLITIVGLTLLLMGKYLIIFYQADIHEIIKYVSYSIAFIVTWILVYLITHRDEEKEKEENSG